MRANLHWTAGLHHDGSSLYVSNLAPQIGDRVTLKLRAPADAPSVPAGEPQGRWLWALVLVLLAAEAWWRRMRPSPAAEAPARVA